MDITEEKTGSGGRYVATLEGHEADAPGMRRELL